MSNKSVVPPMPSDVKSCSETPGRSSTPRAARRAATGLSLIRMMLRLRQLRSDQHGKLIERAAHAPRADGQHRIAGLGFAQKKLDAHLHVTGEDHILVARGTDRHGKGLAIYVLDGSFARGINISDNQNIGLIK